MAHKLGKKPARPGAVSFRFGDFFDRRKLPAPPARFGHESIGRAWGMLANDDWSNCVFAGAAHETMMWCAILGKMARFSNASVLGDYAAVTGFDPARPESDQGTDMTEAASYRRKTGVLDAAGNRHTIDAYVAIRAGDVLDLAVATYLTNAVGVGLRFPDYAMDQFDAREPWHFVPGKPEPVGGHYVPCLGRNTAGNYMVVTWGRIHAMTPDFYATYCDEALAYVSFEQLRDNVSPEGFDAATLRHNLAALAA